MHSMAWEKLVIFREGRFLGCSTANVSLALGIQPVSKGIIIKKEIALLFADTNHIPFNDRSDFPWGCCTSFDVGYPNLRAATDALLLEHLALFIMSITFGYNA